MMQKRFVILGGASLLAGMLIFALQQGWIIIRSPRSIIAENYGSSSTAAHKKKITLYFWQHERWQQERTHILWSDDVQNNATLLINSWLSLLEEDGVMSKKVSLQQALLAQSGNELYLSFDQNPFEDQATTYQKWYWLEGLLKTLRENDIKVQKVHFMVHHQPLTDPHLDFSNGWPLQGFI
jgi:hypothetical protein